MAKYRGPQADEVVADEAAAEVEHQAEQHDEVQVALKALADKVAALEARVNVLSRGQGHPDVV